MNKVFGLIGKNISYSFSKKYFTDKFEKEEMLGYSYENFDLQAISQFPKIIRENPNLRGLNVTIPYKEKIIPYLDKLEENATKRNLSFFHSPPEPPDRRTYLRWQQIIYAVSGRWQYQREFDP